MLPVAEELVWEHSGTLGVGPAWGSEKESFFWSMLNIFVTLELIKSLKFCSGIEV